MYDLIIIGSGPAGIVAGIYAWRKKLKTLVLTKDFLGQAGLTGVIENWPGEKEISGPGLMNKFEDHLKNYDIEIKEEEVVSLRKKESFIIKTEKEEFKSRSAIISTGRKAKELKVAGEKEFIGKGVVYCTTCDAPLFKNKKVLVVGGGNAGFESAIELADHAKEVLIFEAFSQITADEFLQEKAEKRDIKVFKNRKIKEIKGNNFLEEIVYQSPGKEETMKVDGLFIQIGSVAITDFIKEDLVDFDERGDIKIDFKTCQTKTKGLFAAGDVTDIRDKQIVIATGEGAKAALSAYNYLKK